MLIRPHVHAFAYRKKWESNEEQKMYKIFIKENQKPGSNHVLLLLPGPVWFRLAFHQSKCS